MTGQRLVDLSHPVISGTPGYPGLPVARIEPYIAHAASRPAYDGQAEFEITRVFLVGNTGTYLDSPYHRDPGRPDVAALPLSSIAGLPGRRLRSDWRGPGPRPVRPALPNDLAGCAVLIATGWDRRWGRPAYWRPGPFVDTRLADELVAAGVALVGVDFWNVDDIRDPSRPAHTRLLRAGIPIVEHLTGLDALPDSGFRFSAVPAPIQAASSLPVRAFAELDEAGSF